MHVLGVLLISSLLYATEPPRPVFKGDECSTLDASDGMGEAWLQADTSWCHAFTTADALTRHLLNKGRLKPGERMHPMQFAAAKPLSRQVSMVNSTDMEGTMLSDMLALSSAKHGEADSAPKANRFNEGLCRESDLKSAETRAAALFNENWRTAIDRFDAEPCIKEQMKCAPGVASLRAVRAVCDKLSSGESQY